jgi:membrane-associated protein
MNGVLPYLLNWLQEYGYPILWLSVFVGALGVPLPNSLVLLAAGAFAAYGDFNFPLLAVVSISAFVLGDNGSYWIGRLWGSKVLDWLENSHRVQFIKPETVARSRVYFAHLGGWAIFFSRFLVSILGGAINILAGAELYPYRRFLFFDVSGETLGALLPLSLGYIFAASWEAVGDILGSFSFFILAFFVVLFLGYQALKMYRRVHKVKGARQVQAIVEVLEMPPASPGLSGPDKTSPSPSNLPL